MIYMSARDMDAIDEFRNLIKPIHELTQEHGYVLLVGRSGYSSTPYRCEVGRYNPEYPLAPYRTHSGDSFTDGGSNPTHFLPLPF